MRIAIISDTHDRATSVYQALTLMAERGVELIIHCGDICSPSTIELFPAHTHFVFGNCDHELEAVESAVKEIGATWHGAWGHLELAGCSLAFTHGDNHQLLHELEHADAFDFLFHGHTHVAREHRTNKTRIINPGALQRVVRRTFLILDLPGGATESVTVE